MEDILLKKFFETERWEDAIETGVAKGINKGELRKLLSPETRLELYQAIKNDNYEIAPPHQAKIPKDNGEFRTVYVNENVDRIILSIINNLFFETYPEMVHERCKSYQTGVGCGKVVKEVSQQVINTSTEDVGFKSDLSKYFDSVPIQYIDAVFDNMEKKTGQSKIIDVVRKYYHNDLCFDVDGNLIHQYNSLKQGASTASFLADAVLYDIDNELSKMDVYYVRYSDDILCIGNEYNKAFDTLKKMLEEIGLTLNPKKVETINKNRWFKFLGFNIKGSQISISKSRLKDFQHEIESRTINQRNTTPKRALKSVNSFLYVGDGQYSWATSVLPVINVDKDITILNGFILDCLRAVETGKTKIGGLGSAVNLSDHTIMRGTGRNVKANKNKTAKVIDGYYTLSCMRNALLTSKPLYDTIVRQMEV